MLTDHAIERLSAPDVDRLVVGLSGGVDSLVLLNLVAKAALAKPLLAIHVNHGLQPAAEEFEDTCRQLCKAMGLTLVVRTVQVDDTGSIETSARRARYRAFEEFLEPGDLLLLAHHDDDQVETTLFRLFRGSRLPGLEGMPAERPVGPAMLYRPLLGHSRQQILDYARLNNISWIEDPANRDLNPDRNFIRHELMPLLEKRWPGVRERLLSGLARDRAARETWRAENRVQLDRLREAPDILNLPRARSVGGADLMLLLDAWVLDLAYPIPAGSMLEEVVRRVGSGEPIHVSGNDIAFRQHGERLYLLRVLAKPDPGRMALEPGNRHFSGRTISNTITEGQGLKVGPLYETGYRTGGESLKQGKSRTLKNLFQKHGLPDWVRPHVPLIFQGDELVAIAAVPGWGLPMLLADGWGAGPGESGHWVEVHLGDRAGAV